MQWVPVMELEELWEGDWAGVRAGAAEVLIVNVDGEIRAYENRCPHQGWPLHEGTLDGCLLTCANHHWVFDVLTGKGVNPDDARLKPVPVRVDDAGMIQVAPA